MLGPEQVIRRMVQVRRAVQQLPQVAFPIRDLPQAGGGETLRELGHPLIAPSVQPAFRDIDLALGLSSPHPGVQDPQRCSRKFVHCPRRRIANSTAYAIRRLVGNEVRLNPSRTSTYPGENPVQTTGATSIGLHETEVIHHRGP